MLRKIPRKHRGIYCLYFIVVKEIEEKKDIALVWGYHCCIKNSVKYALQNKEKALTKVRTVLPKHFKFFF